MAICVPNQGQFCPLKDELHNQSTGSECKHLQTGCKNYLLDSFGHEARIDLILSKNKNYLVLF